MVSLRVRDVSKSYGGVQALKPVSFDVNAGEVHALLGENGAGKSTLIRIMSGLTAPDGGVIEIDGQSIIFRSPRDAVRAGVVTVHQELLLFPDLSIAENIGIGGDSGGFGRIDLVGRQFHRQFDHMLGKGRKSFYHHVGHQKHQKHRGDDERTKAIGLETAFGAIAFGDKIG